MSIRNILKLAAQNNVSDVHIIFGRPPIFRIEGELFDSNEIVGAGSFPPCNQEDLDKMLDELLDKELKKRFLDKRDIDLSYQIEGFRYRLNLSFEKSNVRLVARVVRDKEWTLDELGLPPIVADLLNLSQGLVLVTGPTGCGKSTTLAAMINHLNSTRSLNIITLEDPTEYIFKPKMSIISQRQLGSDMNSFASGLKHVLRQDPNVIMLGEMRDLETISTALTVAETGHLVLATLHTYSAVQTIDRIIDIFPPHQQNQIRSQLSMVLAGVISQRLLPKEGGGRIAAREIMLNNSAIANLIREGKIPQIKSVLETSSNSGMITLDKSIRQLYQAGLVSRGMAISQMENSNTLDD